MEAWLLIMLVKGAGFPESNGDTFEPPKHMEAWLLIMLVKGAGFPESNGDTIPSRRKFCE